MTSEINPKNNQPDIFASSFKTESKKSRYKQIERTDKQVPFPKKQGSPKSSLKKESIAKLEGSPRIPRPGEKADVSSDPFEAFLETELEIPESLKNERIEESNDEVVQSILNKVANEDLQIFQKLIDGIDTNQQSFEKASSALSRLLNQLNDVERSVFIDLVMELAEGKEDVLKQLVEIMPPQSQQKFHSLLYQKMPISHALTPIGDHDINALRGHLTILGFEPLIGEIPYQSRLFFLLPTEQKEKIIKNMDLFVQKLSKNASSEPNKFTPLDLIKLHHLAKTIQSFYQKGNPFQTEVKALLENIINCQTVILKSQDTSRKMLFTRLVSDWSLMEDLREQTFPLLYQQAIKAAPVNLEGKNKSWFTHLEQLEYIKQRAEQEKTNKPSSGLVMDKVIQRANLKIEKLLAGEQVKMPCYYHGTSTIGRLTSIIQDSIHSTDALQGKGAYISTRMEPDYAPYYFALDREDVEKEVLSKESAVNKTKFWAGVDDNSWRALKKDIGFVKKETINEKEVITSINLAYVAVPDDEVTAIQKELSNLKLDKKVEVVPYSVALAEQKFLRELRGNYEPYHWAEFWQNSMNNNLSATLAKFKQPDEPAPPESTPTTNDEWE